MPYPLLLRAVLQRARSLFPGAEVVSRTPSGIHRYTNAALYERVCRLANVLKSLGVGPGDRVGTLAWNHYRHLELYYAAPCSGAVLHTVNFRLFPDQLAYVVNHAADKVLFIDPDVVPAVEAVAGQLRTVKRFVVLAGRGDLPQTSLPVEAYEDLLAAASPVYDFPEDLDENSPAAMCYTSATTGNPKGVVYSHRTLYLHTAMQSMADTLAISERDTILPVVPMFHVNAWGLPWSAGFNGSRLVLPGPRPDPRALAGLIQQERVTLAAGVPTVWLGVLDLVRAGERFDFSSIRCFTVGGSAVPRALLEAYDQLVGAPILHAYGMTEAAPLTHVGRLRVNTDGLETDGKYRIRAKQGMITPGLEQRIVNEQGEDVPWDGKSLGEVYLRGPWVGSEYYDDPRTADSFQDGWYHTGDVATIDERGYLEIADRTKDLVKSGGEWISSVDIENHLMAHPAVREAAVIAVPHPRWQERPVACVVLRPEQRGAVSEQDLLAFLGDRVAKWWLPDRVLFIDEVPKTGVGKFDKKVLRAEYQGLLSG